MLFLDIPDSAAVDLAVTHAKSDPRTARFSGLVNGVLRGLARDKDSALPRNSPRAMKRPAGSATAWQLPMETAQGAGDPCRARIEAPVDFTVKSDPQRWAEALGGVVLPTGSIRVEHLAGPVAELPGYADGDWWSRTRPQACRRGCSAISTAEASPTFARLPAARPRSSRLPAPK